MSVRNKRIIHVIRAMNRGGVETWLMHVLRRLDSRRVQMDFLVHSAEPGEFDDEIIGRGSRLLRCLEPLWSPQYPLHLRRLLCEGQGYDAVHSHVHHFSGCVLRLARLVGVPSRIAHSHSASSGLESRDGWFRKAYLRATDHWIRTSATKLLGASRTAARALFGANWEADPRCAVVHCGLDFTPFHRHCERYLVREQWKIGPGAFVMGHVGRFDVSKNHAFLVEVAAEAVRRRPETKVLLVGEGRLRPDVLQQVRRCGLERNFVFTGVRQDIPRLLRAMDVFVFPSVREGLGLSLIEAQAAGLPCVFSDAIPKEAEVIPELMHRLPLSSAERWASVVLNAGRRSPLPAPEALSRMEASSFSVSRSVEQLYALYNA
jgi:glycosyltransferase involved in cell wall biosynthesis